MGGDTTALVLEKLERLDAKVDGKSGDLLPLSSKANCLALPYSPCCTHHTLCHLPAILWQPSAPLSSPLLAWIRTCLTR